jgi:hypothetical protein
MHPFTDQRGMIIHEPLLHPAPLEEVDWIFWWEDTTNACVSWLLFALVLSPP